MTDRNYLHIDCEMGGKDIKYSLLTAYFMVTDDQFNPIPGAELHLFVKPDDGDYILSGKGMSVNQINIVDHDKIAIPYKQASPLLYQFLKKYSTGTHLTPVGHGIYGDIKFITTYLISRGSWDNFCSYHYIDTSVVLQFLRVCGKMPLDRDGSVKALAEYFKIPVNGTLHDAKIDTEVTLQILKQFIDKVN